eukprot:scaffold219433_cov75-Attheya_sp.AAC.1
MIRIRFNLIRIDFEIPWQHYKWLLFCRGSLLQFGCGFQICDRGGVGEVGGEVAEVIMVEVMMAEKLLADRVVVVDDVCAGELWVGQAAEERFFEVCLRSEIHGEVEACGVEREEGRECLPLGTSIATGMLPSLPPWAVLREILVIVGKG